MVLAWNEKTWPSDGEHPTTWNDLYDTQKFPGKRCFFNNPQYGWTLESALLADGVAPESLYPLDTDRAFAKLDTIKNDVTWWSSGAQSIESFENGSCDLGILWANRAFTAKQENGFPLGVSWDQAGYANSVWAIPADAPNAKAAQYLLKSVIENTKGQIAFGSRGSDAGSSVHKWREGRRLRCRSAAVPAGRRKRRQCHCAGFRLLRGKQREIDRPV